MIGGFSAMKILELVLRIVVKLLEVLTKSPSTTSKSNNVNERETPPSVEERTSFNHNPHINVNYSGRVRDTLNKIIESHNAIHMQDLETIKSLREEICELQMEVIRLRALIKNEEQSDDMDNEKST